MVKRRPILICVILAFFFSGRVNPSGHYDPWTLPSERDIWEARNMTADIKDPVMRQIIETYVLYCPGQDMCYGNYTRQFDFIMYFKESCCGSCNCADDCAAYGNCCPTLIRSSVSDITHQLELTDAHNSNAMNLTFTCTDPQVLPFPSTFNAPSNYFMVDRCPEHLSAADDELVGLCHDLMAADSLSSCAPVTSSVSDLTYKNMFCAICHGESTEDLTSWKLQLQCKTPPKEYALEAIKRSIFELSQCNLIYDPPAIVQHSITICPRNYTSRCNITGLWTVYDAVIEKACHAFTTTYKSYGNIFCYLCNTDSMGFHQLMCAIDDLTSSGGVDFTSFTALLDFRPNKDELLVTQDNGDVCDVGERYDNYKSVCRPLQCPRPLVLENKNLTCIEPFEALALMKYEMHIKFSPNEPIPQWCTECTGIAMDIIKQEIGEFFSGWLYLSRCEVRAWYSTVSDDPRDDIPYFVVDLALMEHTYHDFTDVMEQFLSFGSRHIEVGQTPVANISLETSFMRKQTRDNLGVREYGFWFDFMYPDLLVSKVCTNTDTPTTTVELVSICPQVSLNDKEMTIIVSGTSILIYDLNISFHEDEFKHCDDINMYTMCAEKYFEKTDMLEGVMVSLAKDNNIIAVILSIVCTGISALSLLVTIVTYSFFQELRTLPGKNNMVLSITLLIAQCLYAFSPRFRDFETLCIISGMLTHFFWLAAVFWMNVCCIHMFRVFRSVDKIQVVTHPTRSLILYIIYTIICPAVVISVNIALSSMTSGGNSLGYGGSLCYITSLSMILYTFAIPVGLILVVNIALFFMVAWKLSRMQDVRSDRQRNNLKIYAKLSSLTGASWVFGFLYVLTRQDVFSYVFIILTAGQGFFIMLAFVFNRRVRVLYSTLCSRKPKPVLSHQQNTNLTNLSGSRSTRM